MGHDMGNPYREKNSAAHSNACAKQPAPIFLTWRSIGPGVLDELDQRGFLAEAGQAIRSLRADYDDRHRELKRIHFGTTDTRGNHHG